MQLDPQGVAPEDLSHAGSIVDKAIEYMMDQKVAPISAASALLGGFIGSRSEEPSRAQRPDSNAVLMLVSIRSVRDPSVRLLGERVGGDPISLYLIGVKVRVDADGGNLVLRSRSNSVVASLRPHEDGSDRVTVEGPGLDGPVYTLFRS